MTILLDRLKNGGAEVRIWSIQYGFRSKRGTVDAILLARRVLEQSRERLDRRILMLVSDWSKVFDSVCPEKLVGSLRRFGVPADFVDVIASIYSHRRFFVREGGYELEWYS